MINTSQYSRKNNVSGLWQIIGDVWQKAKNVKETRKLIESYWTANSLIAEDNINSLLNNYDLLCQKTIFKYLGVIFLKDFNKNIIKRKRKDGFNLEYKLFFKEINSDIKYVVPPVFFTNDVRSPDLCRIMFTGHSFKIYPRERKLVLVHDDYLEKLGDLKNHIFYDSKNTPFLIENISGDVITYKKIILNKEPVEGEINITSKFELVLNNDYLVENYSDFLIFRFKESTFFDDQNNALYSFDNKCIDTYLEKNFGYQTGLIEENFKFLRDSNFSNSEINQFVLDLWKINQRDYDFQQIYRLGALVSKQSFARNLVDDLILLELDTTNRKAFLGKIQTHVIVEILNYNFLPVGSIIDKNVNKADLKIIKIKDGFGENIQVNDGVIINKKFYQIKRVYSDGYYELNQIIENSDIQNIAIIISKETFVSYDLNSYGAEELTKYITLSNGEESNLSDILDMSSTVKFGDTEWGNFKWGDSLLTQINSKCRFPKLEVGKSFKFGDAFQPNILPNFYYVYDYDSSETENRKYLNNIESAPVVVNNPNKIISNYYIQKELALKNKSFSQSNFEEFGINRVLLLLPFFNYSSKLEINENSLEHGWTLTDATVQLNENPFYIYSTVNSEENSSITFPVTLKGKSLLRLFVRLNKGKIRVGISQTNSFLDEENSFVKFKEVNEAGKWEYINIFVDGPISNSKILFESLQESNFDVFGIQVYDEIPEYFQTLFNNKTIFDSLLNSYNYKLINLL